jgi:cytochrome c biogenesis protein CcmG, thiol:disulfide interchange protein DsbE
MDRSATPRPPASGDRRRRASTRFVWFLAPPLAFVGLLAVATLGASGAPGPGDPAPAFEASLLDGPGTLSLEDLKGKPAVLNFWASWCKPCEDEAPALKRAHEEYGDRVSIVGIGIRDARSDAQEFIARHGLDYAQVRDEDLRVYRDFGLTGQPETFFLDAEGVVVEHIPGPVFEDDLFALLDVLVSRDG